MLYKEYGGFIEFETYYGTELHNDAIALNCGRNCLAYLIEARQIKKIYLPFLICSSVEDICQKYNVSIQYYHIDKQFLPCRDFSLKNDEYFYLVNYYGQLNNETIGIYYKKFPRLIVDNAQAFFQKPLKGIDTLYTCRKYFGVADGAYLYTKTKIKRKLDIDYSFERMNFLMGRFEKGAGEFYNAYVKNNERFCEEPILQMSSLTHNLLRGISYDKIAQRRTDNFMVLQDLLGAKNGLELTKPWGPFFYPMYIANGAAVRKVLQDKKIYIPTLWSNVINNCGENTIEYNLASNLLPISVDQRYDGENMKYLAQEVLKCIS